MESHRDVRAELGTKSVAVIGLGGLGSNAAAMLLRCGVQTLTLADFDVVDESNLNRQLFFRDQIGLPKTEALAATLRRIDPGVRLTLVHRRLGESDVCGIGSTVDLLLEAVDDAAAKAMILNECARSLPDLRVVAASGLAGLGSANTVVTEALSDRMWIVGDLTSDVAAGLPLLASRVMVAAAHEAHGAVRILLGFDEP